MLEDLERQAKEIGRVIDGALNGQDRTKTTGFVLWLFDFGPGGFATYVSNASREGMIDALEELLEKVKDEGGNGHDRRR